MPLSFSFLGMLNIGLMFFGNIKKLDQILIFLGLVFFEIGYFISPIPFEKFSLNICNVIGGLLCVIGCVLGLKNKKLLVPVFYSVLVSLVYFLVCIYDYNYLIFFRPLYLGVVLAFVSLFISGLKSKLTFSLITCFVCEILSLFVIGTKLHFYPLFTPDILNCIVPVIYFILLQFGVSKLVFRRKKIEKKI